MLLGMILPRFSIRTAMIGLTIAAMFFVVVGDAVRGKAWAVAISVGIASLLVTLLFHVLLYTLSAVSAKMLGSKTLAVRTSQGALQKEAASTPSAPVSSDNKEISE